MKAGSAVAKRFQRSMSVGKATYAH